MKKMMKTLGVAKVVLLAMTTALMLVIGMVGEIVKDLSDMVVNIEWSKQLFKPLNHYLGSDKIALC